MKIAAPACAVLAALLLALSAGSASAQPGAQVPAADARAAVSRQEYQALMERAFAKQDVTADGYLDNGILFQELTDGQLAAMDTDGDGRVSKDEFMAHAMQAFRD